MTTPHEADRDLSTPWVEGESSNLRDWLLGLPWVVERVVADAATSVRLYAIECDFLARSCIWAVTGLTGDGRDSVSLIVPFADARAWHRSGWGKPVLRLPADDSLVTVATSIDALGIEELALFAYARCFERAAEAP
jgi:hypothetical protein